MFVWLLQNTVLAGLLAVGVALLCRWKRCTPAMRHALWLLVLLRLAMPPGVMSWPWTIPLPSLHQSVEAQTAAEPAKTYRFVIDDAEVLQSAPEVETAVAAEPAEAAMVASEPFDWAKWAWRAALGVWLGGAIVVAVVHLRGFVRLHRFIRRGEPAPPWLARRVAELANRLGIHSPRVCVIDELASPLIVGFLRPALLWPRNLHERLNEDGLRAVLLHELAHLRRRDHWVRWLEMASGCVWWWNPLFRLARRRIRQYAELACDAWVLAVLPKARRAYAEALLQVCESVTRTVQPAPALGVGGDSDDFQRRLTMIMRESVACRMPRKALLAIGLLAMLFVPGWTLGDSAKETPTTPAPEAGKPLGVLLDGDMNFNIEVLDKLLQTTADEDRDKKLEELEAQIQGILKEIKALKAEKAKGQAARVAESEKFDVERAKAQVEAAKRHFERALADSTRARQEASARHAEAMAKLAIAQAAREREVAEKVHSARHAETKTEVSRTRVTYTLPHEKAMALAVFLRDYSKTGLSECVVEGDQLTVTAQPGTQRIIGRLVGLLRGPGSENK